MRYRDLIQFDPIDSIIQLREADSQQAAAHLVRTYVISQRMADQLANLVFEQLQLNRPVDNRGVLIVGNYGTGKSHLMAVISALAEHADLVDEVRNPAVQAAAGAIAGRFKVLRTEIGGVQKSLRDIVLDELEYFLGELGIAFNFPAANQVANNKEALIRAMGLFQARYPGQGLLFVLDELLDYLRTREERALILDLGFLRELGEIVELTPFRLLAGIQETLFDNPRFAFVAEQLRRVRDRFEQVRIAREDIAFVVSERLLRKTDAQKARVTEHLQRFAGLYPLLAERTAEFASLFPIHPAYIETFERVYIAEKREVLKTFSQAIRAVLDEEVPDDQPGVISYDNYWRVLQDNPSLRTLPGITRVVEASTVLEGRVRNAYTRPALRPIALRIIDGLSVHRLTTSDVNSPLGVTAEELRDSLFLWTPLPGPVGDADFLAGNVKTALREIMRTVSGQFISYNDANGQYYLDPAKVIDFDAQIAERGEFMSEADLNRYFFDGLQQLLGLPSSVYVTGYNIWEYELPWRERNVTRPGYLFFGHPTERSTAQPPRDFYVYILPPFGQTGRAPAAPVDARPDEVLLALYGLDSAFEDVVRRFAGARLLALTASEHRETYADKADTFLRQLMRWLREHLTERLRVSYRGVTRTVAEVLAQTRSSASRDPEELIKVLAAHLLAPHLGDVYPDYPRFSRLAQPVSEAARAPSAQDAIRLIALRTRTHLAIGVLDGLGLLDDQENIRTDGSRYARYFLDKLLNKPDANQVVNQGEVIEQVAAGPRPLFKDLRFKLEPEWVAVVLTALVYEGQITLHLGGSVTLDAGSVERAAATAVTDLADFRYYGRPKDLPLAAWRLIFDGLGLQSGLLAAEPTRAAAVQGLQAQVQRELAQVVTWQAAVQGGLRLWNEALLTEQLDYSTQDGQVLAHSSLPSESLARTDLLPALRQTKEFLETLSRFNTPGKLRNLQLGEAAIGAALTARRGALRTQQLLDLIAQLQPAAAYLAEAQANLPLEHAWVQASQAARSDLLNSLRRTAKGQETFDLPNWQRRLAELRRQYQQVYADLHRRFVLGPAEDDRRVRIMQDRRVAQLKALAAIDILHSAGLEGWRSAISAITTCRQFHEGLLEDGPTCPHCHFRPLGSAGGAPVTQQLALLDERLDTMLAQWHAALADALRSQTAQHSMAGMTPQERQPLEAYLAGDDPAGQPLPPGLAPSANQALRGIDTVPLHVPDLLAALKAGGLPCTVEQLHQRVAAYVQQVMHGHDARNTRLTLEE
jgi:hypothetical protein